MPAHVDGIASGTSDFQGWRCQQARTATVSKNKIYLLMQTSSVAFHRVRLLDIARAVGDVEKMEKMLDLAKR